MGRIFKEIRLGAIHKRRLLRGGGRGDPPKADERRQKGSRNDFSFRGYQAKGDEKRQGEGGGVINLEKWTDVVYGWPLICVQNLCKMRHAHAQIKAIHAHHNGAK